MWSKNHRFGQNTRIKTSKCGIKTLDLDEMSMQNLPENGEISKKNQPFLKKILKTADFSVTSQT